MVEVTNPSTEIAWSAEERVAGAVLANAAGPRGTERRAPRRGERLLPATPAFFFTLPAGTSAP